MSQTLDDFFDHPVLLGVSLVLACVVIWPALAAFARSARDDYEEAAREPWLLLFGWTPDWTIYKFAWVLAGFVALTITFYKFLSWIVGLVH